MSSRHLRNNHDAGARWIVPGLAGLFAVVFGAFMISRGAGVITVGVLVLAIAANRYQHERTRERREERDRILRDAGVTGGPRGTGGSTP